MQVNRKRRSCRQATAMAESPKNPRNPRNPRKWRFTWEAQSHSPNLRLFLFDSHTNPRLQCDDLNAHLLLPQSHLLVTWTEDENGSGAVSLTVPVPMVLIDADSPLNLRALDDYIEIKLVLLLPVDHPIVVSSFSSILDEKGENGGFDGFQPLIMDSDLKSLSSTEGVHFHCRNCSVKLTRNPLRNFLEMPSVNWREVADNWFGTCCCSFGGVSEKIVARYAESYRCAKGSCLLSATTVILSKDDLEESRLIESNGSEENQFEPSFALSDGLSKAILDCESQENGIGCDDNQSETTNGFNHDRLNDTSCAVNAACGVNGDETDPSKLYVTNEASLSECCLRGTHDTSEASSFHQKLMNVEQLAPDKKFLLNGFLEDVFMARPSHLSGNIRWVDLVCHKCSSLLGAYPSARCDAFLYGGVQLFKCYISTSPAVGCADLFRKYTLERMFTNQLVESAKDELSFRVVVKDLATKTPLLQVVLLNPNSLSCTGYCSSRDDPLKSALKTELRPVVKVLFSDFSSSTELQLRVLGNKVMKDLADEVFMLKSQAEELISSLAAAHEFLPPSCAYLQGLPVSSMHR